MARFQAMRDDFIIVPVIFRTLRLHSRRLILILRCLLVDPIKALSIEQLIAVGSSSIFIIT